MLRQESKSSKPFCIQRGGNRTRDLHNANEKINYKVPAHSEAKVPVILALGEREAAQKSVSIRRIGSRQTTVKPLAEAIVELQTEATPPA